MVELGEEYAKYKPMGLDVAQWTLSSGELQALVSGAIRESADARFVRCVVCDCLVFFSVWRLVGLSVCRFVPFVG